MKYSEVMNNIIAWETGTLDPDDVVPFFQALVDTGLVWTLQGAYGRQATAMIDAGEITP